MYTDPGPSRVAPEWRPGETLPRHRRFPHPLSPPLPRRHQGARSGKAWPAPAGISSSSRAWGSGVGRLPQARARPYRWGLNGSAWPRLCSGMIADEAVGSLPAAEGRVGRSIGGNPRSPSPCLSAASGGGLAVDCGGAHACAVSRRCWQGRSIPPWCGREPDTRL
jgi:hypothetical protein